MKGSYEPYAEAERITRSISLTHPGRVTARFCGTMKDADLIVEQAVTTSARGWRDSMVALRLKLGCQDWIRYPCRDV